MTITGRLSEAQAIESALIGLVLSKEFPRVTYPKDLDGDSIEDNPLNLRSVVHLDDLIEPTQIDVQQVDKRYGEDPDKQSFPAKRRISQWLWQVNLAFPCRVSTDLAEADFAEAPPVIVRDDANEVGQYILNLERANNVYAPRVDSERGTVASFTFRAKPARN